MGVLAAQEASEFTLIALPVLAVAAIGLFWLGVRALKRKRLIENVPTSKVEGVCLGLTELKGKAECKKPLTSYLAECACVYYRFSVEEHWERTETYTDKDGKTRTRTSSGWTTVRSGEQRVPFRLVDDTGSIRVVPERAEIQADRVFNRTCTRYDPLYYSKGPAFEVANSTGRRRFFEYAIKESAPVYVLGTARLEKGAVRPEIGYDRDDPLFLISTSSERAIVRGYGFKSAASLIVGCALAAGFGFTLALIGWAPLLPSVGAAVFGSAYVIAVGLAYLQTVYNGLIDVRNRLRNAASMIDVELKRRHDLIPNLASLVEGYTKHEREIHEQLAALRANAKHSGVHGQTADAMLALEHMRRLAQAADQQSALLGQLYGVAERYPELHADQRFLELAKEIARTERRIALLRSFYNESVTAYNNRIATMPDLLVAKPLGFQEANYLQIQAFERAPIAISFDDEEQEQEPQALSFDEKPPQIAPDEQSEA